MSRSPSKNAKFPSKEQLIEFIESASSRPTRRELLREFKIGARNRAAFKELLEEIRADGPTGHRQRRAKKDHALPRVTVIEVTGTDDDGDVLARPVRWDGEGDAPIIYLRPDRRAGRAPGAGDRLLARLDSQRDGSYKAEAIRRLETGLQSVLGVYLGDGRVRSTDRKARGDFVIPKGGEAGAEVGELLVIRPLPAKRLGPRTAELTERLGVRAGPKSFSMMALHNREIPNQFSEEAVSLAAAARPAPLGARTDLRDLPLITIDDIDARDFDDAVWAEPDPDHPGGWHIVVAIADVAWYVRPGDAIDHDARLRGNSIYFPDRVVPMLPEDLSAGLCSLKPNEDRPCLVAHMWISENGRLVRHQFERALMRSAARLTYAEVQSAHDGDGDDKTRGVMASTIEPLYGAYATRLREREMREPLELEFPERRFDLNAEGEVTGVTLRARLNSHRLIEEFMILANVAAAETLERAGAACLYRVHDEPGADGLEALREILSSHEMRLPKGQVLRPSLFNHLLGQLKDDVDRQALQIAILRAQSQAVYDPANIGHFGLALRHYAHFTSPIRRYSDLMVHRALITAIVGGDGGILDDREDWKALGEHVSMTERRAVGAEREASDRFAAAFLAGHIGEIYEAEVSGVTSAGAFVQLDGLGIDGFIPARFLTSRGNQRRPSRRPNRRTRVAAPANGPQVGHRISVRLREVDAPSGSIILEPV